MKRISNELAGGNIMRFAFFAIIACFTLILSTSSARAEGKEEETQDEPKVVIELVGDNEYVILEGQDFEDKGARLVSDKELLFSWRFEADDVVVRDDEGRVSELFTKLFPNMFCISERINSKKTGTYNPEYTFEEESVDYTVHVVSKENVKPFKAYIELADKKERWVKRGTDFEDTGAMLYDEDENLLYSWKLEDGKVVVRNAEGEVGKGFESEFCITCTVDTSKVGDYTLIYEFAGKTVIQVVHVWEDMKKVDAEPKECKNSKQELEFILAILGEKKMEVEQGKDYKEPGYRVADKTGKVYKSLEACVEVKGEVNTKVTGKNLCNYSIYENGVGRTVLVVKSTGTKTDTADNKGQEDNGSEEPVYPDNPSKPDKPDTPEQPDQPDKPDNPDKPDQPDKPDKPDTPDNPNKPDIPDVPDNPDKPSQPDQPDEPEIPDPIPGGPIGPGNGEPGQVENEDIPNPTPGGPIGPGTDDPRPVE